MKQVVIIGAAFAGLNAAKALSNRPNIAVTLIDRRNYHLFQPLLYQVAMAGLSPAEIAVPIRSILADSRNIVVLQEEALAIDLVQRTVTTDVQPLHYDALLIACGAESTYFGHNEWEEFAPALKSMNRQRRSVVAS